MGMQLASVSSVVPFILAEQGIVWAASLVFPTFSVGYIVGNSVSPFTLARFRRTDYLVAATTAVVAALVAGIALAASVNAFLAVVSLAAVSLIGIAFGVASDAYTELLSSRLSKLLRNRLLLNEEAIGAVLVVGATLLVVPLLSGRDPVSGRVDLLWLGAAGMAIAGVSAVFVGSSDSRPDAPSSRMADTYRQGVDAIRTQAWFRYYLMIQLLFVPVSLGVLFFSLRASSESELGGKSGNLHLLVICCSVGLVAGAFLWRFVYGRFGVRGMLLAGGLLSSSAAVIAIAADLNQTWSPFWIHGTVFFSASVAGLAIATAPVSWISAYADERQRATLIGFGATLVAVVSTLLGWLLGTIAQWTSTIWPVAIMLILSLAATAAAVRAPNHNKVITPDATR